MEHPWAAEGHVGGDGSRYPRRWSPDDVGRARSTEGDPSAGRGRRGLADGALRRSGDEALEEPTGRRVAAARQLLRMPLDAEEKAPPRGVDGLDPFYQAIGRMGDRRQGRRPAP